MARGEPGSSCIFLQRTLLGFSPYADAGATLKSAAPMHEKKRIASQGWKCWRRETARDFETFHDSATTHRPRPAQLQSVGREPDARGLCAALHRQACAEMVEL